MTDDYVADTVKAGVEAFLRSEDGEKPKKEDNTESANDDVPELPQDETPITEEPVTEEPADVAKTVLGKPISECSDEELVTGINVAMGALGF